MTNAEKELAEEMDRLLKETEQLRATLAATLSAAQQQPSSGRIPFVQFMLHTCATIFHAGAMWSIEQLTDLDTPRPRMILRFLRDANERDKE
jgi:hypothetical protein